MGPARRAPRPSAAPAAAILAHACAGRMRLSLPELKGQRERLLALCDAMIALPGVTQAEARPATGSLILTHTGPTEAVLAAVESTGLVARVAMASSATSEAGASTASLAEGVGPERLAALLAEATAALGGPKAAVRKLSGVALVLMALRQAGAGNIMPPAATALYQAASLLFPDDAPAEGGRAEGGDGHGDGA